MKEKMKKRDVFYGVIAIATLIVAIIGATLAYFSITVTSAENAVGAGAATVSVVYEDGQQIGAQASQLIPSSFEVVQYAYDKSDPEAPDEVCTDINGEQVCSMYRFSISSDVEREVTVSLNDEYNGFTYLHYAIYDVTSNSWVQLNNAGDLHKALTTCDNATEEGTKCYEVNNDIKTYTNPNSVLGLDASQRFNKLTLNATQKTYDVVLFINENNDNQNVDQGATYSGSISVEVIGATGRITGQMSSSSTN